MKKRNPITGIWHALFLFILTISMLGIANVAFATEPFMDRYDYRTMDGLNIYTNGFSGDFSYTIPIESPPGRNDLQADLSLKYSSQDNELQNLFGIGWSTNIPYIERFNRYGSNILYDNNNFLSSLSGELLAINLSDNTHGTYGPEVENGDFYDYQYLTDGSWQVTDKLGMVYTFGATAASRQDDSSNSTRVYKWMLTEVRDTNDNFIRYEYFKDNNQIYPYKIFYTGHGTADGVFEVEFLRESRPDVTESYKAGFKVVNDYRIHQIQSNINGSFVYKYDLQYFLDENTKQSYLEKVTQIVEENGTEVPLPSTKIDYHNEVPTFSNESQWDISFSEIHSSEWPFFYTGDVNGDGLIDLLYSIDQHIVDGGDQHDAVNKVMINNGNGWTYDSSWSIPIYFYDRHFTSGYGDVTGAQVLDLNGDGLADIFYTHQLTSGSEKYVYINNGNGWTLDNNWEPPVYCFSEQNERELGCYLADINGDGLPDLLKYRENPYEYGVYINNGSGWTLNTSFVIPIHFSYYYNMTPGIRVADINGDDLADILYGRYDNPNSLNNDVYINNGHDWELDTNWELPVAFTGDPYIDSGAKLVDFNNDGLLDIIGGVTYGGSGSNDGICKTVQLNNGDGSWQSIELFSGVPFCVTNPDSSYGTAHIYFYDIDADGFQDVYFNGSHINQQNAYQMVKTIRTENGGKISVDYTPSSDYIDSGNNLLNTNMPFTIQTVSQVNISDRLNATNTKNYIYSGGDYYYDNPRDRRFSGFNLVESESANKTNITYYHQGNSSNSSNGEYQDSYYKIGKAYRTELYDGSNNLIQQELHKWDEYDLGNNNKFVFGAQKSNTDFTDTTKSTASQYIHDMTNGNLLTENKLGEVNINTGTGDIVSIISGDEKDVDYQYASNTTKHILSAPKKKTISDITISKEQDLYYDNLTYGEVNKVNLTKEDYIEDDVEVNRTFNSYGLVDVQVDPGGATTTISYDTNNLYPDITTDSLGNQTLTDYELLNAKIVNSEDINGQETNNDYDGQGRLTETKVSDPDNPSTLITTKELVYGDDFGDIQGGQYHQEFSVDNHTVALWHLDGNTGTTEKLQNETTYNDFDLVEYGNPVYAEGFNGQDKGGYFFNDSSQYLHTNGSSYAPGTGAFAVGFWIKTTLSAVNSIVSAEGSDAIVNIYLNNGKIIASLGWQYQDWWLGVSEGTFSSVNDNQWHYFEAEFHQVSGSQPAVYTYLDGVPQGYTWYTQGYNYNITSFEDGWFIGKGSAINVDEVRVSNTNRWETEISNYYNNYITIPDQPFTPRYTESKDYFTATEYVTSREYYNGLDRVVQQKTETDTSGKYTTVDISYDEEGRVLRKSLPYITNSIDYGSPNLSKPGIDYTYDALDRVLTETSPVGVTTYDYDGFQTTITDANNVDKILTKDAYGNLVEVKEHNNGDVYTTTYDYSLTNKLEKITDDQGNIRNFHYDDLDNLDWQDMVHKSSVTSPAQIDYTHDKNGNVLTENSFKGDAISYEYDDLNRVEYEKLSGDTQIQYVYDENGDIGFLTHGYYGGNNRKVYDYDILGRLTTVTTTIENEDFVMHYDYNLNGDIKEITYPNDWVLTYDFNNIGQVESVDLDRGSGPVTLVDNINYNQNGQMTHLERANGVITDYLYDPDENFRLIHTTSTIATTTLQSIEYSYDDVGNITSIVDSSNTDLAKSVSHTYDDLNRLTTTTVSYTTHSGDNYTQEFGYDEIGNMVYNSFLGTMNYLNDNPHQLSGYATRTFAYDDAGNQKYNGGFDKFHWDHRSRLNSTYDIPTENNTYYKYDHNNQRILKYTEDYVFIPPDIQENFIEAAMLDEDSVYMAAGGSGGGYWEWRRIAEDKYVEGYFEKDLNDNTKTHIFLNSTKIATINNNEDPYFILSDHLGSSNILVDNNGAIAEVSDYLPYGEINYENVITSMDDEYDFTGKEYDEESDTQYFGARYYDNEMGRFLSMDPWDGNLVDPQTLNKYSYTINNPVKYNDPSGETPEEATWGVFVGIGQSVWNTMQSAHDWLWHSPEKVKELTDTAKYVSEEAAELGTELMTYPDQAITDIQKGMEISTQEFLSQSDYEIGKDIGNIAGDAMQLVIAKKAGEKLFTPAPKDIVPNKAYNVLNQIEKNNFKSAPQGYKGGGIFNNKEGLLPAQQRGYYQEWDINPNVRGLNRPAERMVTGQGGEAYYTPDHYKTFTKMK